ncbi:acyltransferase [Sphingomonas sp. R647]|uniref:acyltransferase family protein n=1 Tax=Sphingomonas sp. R647 TaxID=2875233 RepID=UPI001CD7AE16|nr:acyltransferase [Sphingomonas sp. R647]MCA1196364.1 acyltransferase [Sphingomonas sp. R647]
MTGEARQQRGNPGAWMRAMIPLHNALRIEQGQIVALQLLRGVAALAVVVEHLLQRYEKRGALPAELPEFVAKLGQTGVFAFFAISGFIMVFITSRDRQAPPSGAAFLRARFLRVAPLYYLTTLLIVVFAWATQGLGTLSDFRFPTLAEWVGSFLFIPHRGANGLIQPIYGLGWSLHYEMFFYLLFAAGLAIHRRHGVLLVLAVLGLLAALGPLIAAPADRWGLSVIAYVFTRPVMLIFMAGMILARIRERCGDRLPSAPLPLIASVAIAALWLAATLETIGAMLGAIVLALAVCVLVVPRDREAGGRFAMFSSAMGNASYSIYLTHSFVLGAFAAATSAIAAEGPGPLMALVLMACTGCFILGWLTWHLIEVPMTNRLRGKRSRPSEMVAP